jgi:pyrroline-5-carboxylate reductase
VKPQDAGKVIGKIKSALTPESVIISICAGVSVERIRSFTYPNMKVVQVMPNTPMTLGLGASAVAFSDNLPNDERNFARAIIDSCGISAEIPSFRMNEIIAVNASSPAFIFSFAQCFVDYAEKQGIDGDTAFRLFAKTLEGSAKMLTDSGKSIKELIAQVTSEGGTTQAGLDAMRENGFNETVKAACDACTARAYELGQ